MFGGCHRGVYSNENNECQNFIDLTNLFKSNAMLENTSTSSESENENRIFGTTNIIDLNTDCMVAIFMYLSFTDLSNIVESSKQFHFAAFEVYQRNYANKMLIYDPHCNKFGFYFG